MLCFPNAKINIGLNIVEKRPDGYHNLETVFYPIPLCDALEAVVSKDDSQPYHWDNSGIQVDAPGEENICIKAFELLAQDYELPTLNIHLLKKIPFGAGLGGGSADGAFMLKLINDMCELNLSSDKLKSLAAKLGADCPFFIDNKACFAAGIGDQFESLDLNLKGYHIALVKPPIHVSTPVAYAGIKPTKSNRNLKEDILLPIEQWKEVIKNDFETSVFKKYPSIKMIKENLYSSGANYAAMSGSGSTVFGLFKEAPKLKFNDDHFVWSKEIK
ncbi:4-(cytidine 5'-diphospho)-2-C-methyl-D-erythritol kinase [Carboxylicivirga sp. N1Y90]|uniref:4-(cytidine 5'-diphospho)-2-C-methyl-D-erythritol kinase n=1 Tax=Carboxylicivirga fragile TaxID=3417571 RepID=UPI003D340A9C|nr:4-(cytidine 5'-diphospho)-2-C-methyl-D-erythritol kinase [Marinilabiliaceae bacterium N1Y90]